MMIKHAKAHLRLSNVTKRFILLILCISFFGLQSEAQETLGIGSWRSYLPYKYGWSVTQSPDAVFFGTQWALMKTNKEDLSLQYFSKVDGLSDIGVQSVTYSDSEEVLIIAYTNSNIDLVYEDEIINLNQIRNNTQIVGERTINAVFVEPPFAYLACGFGLVQLNLRETEFGFTTFTNTPVRGVCHDGERLLLATENGLFSAPDDGSINLADFSKWNPLGFTDGLPTSYRAGSLRKIGSKIFAGINNALYVEEGDGFRSIHQEPGFEMSFVVENETGLLTGWRCNTGCNGKKILIEQNGSKRSLNNCTSRATDAVIDESGRVWYADENRWFKMSQGFTGECTVITPDRPPTHFASGIATYDRKLYVATGGVTLNYGYLFRADGMYTNANGSWETINRSTNDILREKDMRDFLTIEISDQCTVYVGTFWDGLIEYQGEELTVFDKDNSSLQNSVINPDRNRITDLSFDEQGNLWAVNHDAPRPVSVYTRDGEWHNFAVPTPTNLEHIAVDPQGYKWIAVGNIGLLVFDTGEDLASAQDDRYRLLNATNSGLKVNAINDITVDQDGAVWVATTQGPVLFDCGGSAFDDNCNGIRLIVEQNGIPGELLGEENIKVIAVDGANRKWFGTNNGVFVQSADAEVQVGAFNERNSPLFDNGIVDIAIDPIDGEVFIATNRGIISYRGEATQGQRFHAADIEVFPNPVRPGYDGPIAIRGLAENANVKITDLHGNLVYETMALGGQAIWYGEDLDGNRAASGVYLVYSTAVQNTFNPDAAVTKIMLVN